MAYAQTRVPNTHLGSSLSHPWLTCEAFASIKYSGVFFSHLKTETYNPFRLLLPVYDIRSRYRRMIHCMIYHMAGVQINVLLKMVIGPSP